MFALLSYQDKQKFLNKIKYLPLAGYFYAVTNRVFRPAKALEK